MAGLANDLNPFPTQVRIGPNYIQLVPGPPGPAGTNAVTTTVAAAYTQPAVGSNVTVQVTSTAAMAAGMDVFVQNGGYYSVQSVTDGTHVVLQNTGAAGNVSPGTNVAIGNLVVPAGPAGSLSVQSNDASITQRPILDIVGAQYTDTGTAMRFAVQSFGAPSPAASTLVMTSSSPTWSLIQAGEIITFPSTFVTGVTYEFTDTTGGLESNPVTFQRPGGATYTICDPQNPVAGSSASVTGRVSGVTYRFRYDGSGVLRCVN